MSGFEPPLSRPPDAHFNRTKLHPVINMSKLHFQMLNEMKLTEFFMMY